MKHLRRHPAVRILSWALTVFAVVMAGVAFSVCAGGPPQIARVSEAAHRALRVTDRHGRPLAMELSAMETRQVPVSLTDVSPHVVSALLAAEDRRFHRHGGIDLLATGRALRDNITQLRVVSGGSTLTQQLARLLHEDAARASGEAVPERSLGEKLVEARTALRLEYHHPKDVILTAFLNRAPFGNTATGIEAAARRYFNVSAKALTLAQSAFLVGLVRGPSFYNPFTHRERIDRRTARILERMATLGWVTEGQLNDALAEEVSPRRYSPGRRAVHAVALARTELAERREAVDERELPLTVDAALEDTIRQIMQDEAPRIYSRGARSSAVVVIDVASGEVRAAVGATFESNPHWGEFSAVTALRQPGSALKPFLYGEAIAGGDTPATLAADIEKPFPDTWGIYKPRNYDDLYHGPVRYRAALAQSLNVAAVDVLTRVGLERFFGTLERAGITTLERRPEHYGLGLVLGSAPVRLVDLTNAYAALARDGEWRPWTVLMGREARGEPRQLFEPRVAFLVADMLADGNARAEQFGMRSVLTTPYWAAAKTGTSKGYRDNWTFGFSRDVAVGVWVGDPKGKPMQRISGVEGAGSIWRRTMNVLSGGVSKAPKPPTGLERVRVCSVSGERIGPHCEGGLDEWFVVGTAPGASCSYHRHVRVDPEDGGLIPDECRSPGEREVVAVYPSPHDAWAEASGVGRSERVSAKCQARTQSAATVELLSPAPAESIAVDPDAPLEAQALTFRARVTGSTEPVTFWINGQPVSTVAPPYEWAWPIRPGQHTVQARLGAAAENARSETHHISVY